MKAIFRDKRWALWRPVLITIVLAGGLLVGCANLPDTSGYTAATIQVRQAVVSAGDAAESELVSAISAGATTATRKAVDRFRISWKQTVRSLDAMVAYARSIEGIVDAGNKGEESATRLAESIKGFMDVVKVDLMTHASTEVAGLAMESAAFVYGEIAKIRASKALNKALDKTGPSIVRISGLVQVQVSDAERLFEEQVAAQIAELASGGSGYGDWIKRKSELDEKQQVATKQLVALIADASAPADRIKELEVTVDRIALARKQIEPHLDEYEAGLSQIRRREKAGRAILGAAENAVAAWGTSYQSLVESVKTRRPVSVESLRAAVIDVRNLIQRWRAL